MTKHIQPKILILELFLLPDLFTRNKLKTSMIYFLLLSTEINDQRTFQSAWSRRHFRLYNRDFCLQNLKNTDISKDIDDPNDLHSDWIRSFE